MNTREEIFDAVYRDTPSTENPQGLRPQHQTEMPEGTLHLPLFYDTVQTLGQTVDVDYYLPGCPPEADKIWEAVGAILSGKLPPKGSVIGANTTVCDECKRKKTEKKIKAFKRTWEVIPDAETCLLEQGLVCCGIATRAGCGALCPVVNSPCIGCHGGNEGVQDYGSRLMTAPELGHRFQRSGRDRGDHRQGHSGSHWAVVSIQSGLEPVAPQEASRQERWRAR